MGVVVVLDTERQTLVGTQLSTEIWQPAEQSFHGATKVMMVAEGEATARLPLIALSCGNQERCVLEEFQVISILSAPFSLGDPRMTAQPGLVAVDGLQLLPKP